MERCWGDKGAMLVAPCWKSQVRDSGLIHTMFTNFYNAVLTKHWLKQDLLADLLWHKVLFNVVEMGSALGWLPLPPTSETSPCLSVPVSNVGFILPS